MSDQGDHPRERSVRRIHNAAERVHAARIEAPPTTYEGLITRTIAFSIDAAILNIVAAVAGLALGLCLSILDVPNEVETVILSISGLVYFLWIAGYFVTFWSTSGETPGNRLLRIRVSLADGEPIHPLRAIARLIALSFSAAILLLGFLPILFDDRRRGLHDMLVGTVVTRADTD